MTILPSIISSDVFVERSDVFVERSDVFVVERSDLGLLRSVVREKCDL